MKPPRTAMVLCAGLGTRLKPLTDKTPKPLLELAGKPMIDHLLDKLKQEKIEHVIINLHHHRDMLRKHLSARKDMDVVLIDEDPILETGGGVVNALKHLQEDVFYVLNGDSLWIEKGESLLKSLAAAWTDKMDILLSVYPVAKLATDARTDYFMAADGKLRWRKEGEKAPYIFAGPRLVRRSIFTSYKPEKFSQKVVFDLAEQQGRLYGVAFSGEWLNIDTLDNLEAARKKLAKS